MTKYYAGRNSRVGSNSYVPTYKNSVASKTGHEKEYQIWVNGKNRADLEKYNKVNKLPNDEGVLRVTLNHYGQGLSEGDVVRIFNITPYFKIFEGRYENEILVSSVPG